MSKVSEIVRRYAKSLPDDLSAFTIAHAIRLVRLALLLNPSSAQLNFQMAYFYALAGEPKRSIAYLRRSLKLGFRPLRKITHAGVFREVRQLKEFPGMFENLTEKQRPRSSRP